MRWDVPPRFRSLDKEGKGGTVLLMQFRATRSDLKLPIEEWLYLRDVQCPVCYTLYQLWSPFMSGEHAELQIHTDWLTHHLMNTCPNHANDIRTPDPTAEKTRMYWIEEARAKAIQEAEDAGLRGKERDVFIRERTEMYYAEIIMRRVG